MLMKLGKMNRRNDRAEVKCSLFTCATTPHHLITRPKVRKLTLTKGVAALGREEGGVVMLAGNLNLKLTAAGSSSRWFN